MSPSQWALTNSAMVDFYHGEANVSQENLNSFLALAEELQLKGLRGNQPEKEASTEKRKVSTKLPKSEPVSKQNLMNNDVPIETGILQTTYETVVALTDDKTNSTDIESLKQQVKSMMIISDKADPYKTNGERARMCKMCGKEGSFGMIINHIEANHITRISIPCDFCEKSYKSSISLTVHKSRQHGKDQ